MSGSVQTGMGRKRDEESGRYEETYSHDEVADVVADLGDATTRQVSDQLGCAYQTAYKKLRELEDAGGVTSRSIGNVRLWLPVEDDDADTQ